jgi:outer membrane receptor protein involved in Fe transport
MLRATGLLLLLLYLPLATSAASSDEVGVGDEEVTDEPVAGDAGDRDDPDHRDPPTWEERIVVTASRVEEPASEVPAAVTVLGRGEIERTAARTTDDLLRRIPGFSLFRRAGSSVAHPTTQGASLRGIGPSGASRALVLLDGVPLNDPFGGWVYWSKVPPASVERIEVLRGGGSHLWGSQALGGVIHLLSAEPQPRTLRFEGTAGTRDATDLDLFASEKAGPFAVAVEASHHETGGYVVVREDQRGAIDVPAFSRQQLGGARLLYRPSPTARVSLRLRGFREERGNGTPLTGNATDSESVTLDAGWRGGGGGRWTVVAAAEDQHFDSTFSAQEPDRSAERPALDQFDVGARSLLLGVGWSRRLGAAHRLGAGFDLRLLDGATHEDFFYQDGRFLRRRRAGGEQQLGGVYLREVFTPAERWRLTAALRLDRWRLLDGERLESDLVGGGVLRRDSFPDRDGTALSPRLGALFHATDRLSLEASVYRSFRVPTLNELYRPFRVRNDVTDANAELAEERLTGVEGGLSYRAGAVTLRLTGFWNRVDDPIANVTVGPGPGVVQPCGFVPPGGLCRQRRNLGAARIRGIEAEARWRAGRWWELSASYLGSDAKITSDARGTDAPGQPALEGKRLAQVPEHQLVARVELRRPGRLSASLQGRWVGEQYEDDRNTRVLDDFAVVDLLVSREVAPGRELFLAAENLFGRRYEVARTADGLVSVGPPATLRGGIRLTLTRSRF